MIDKYQASDLFKSFANAQKSKQLSFIHIGNFNECIRYLMQSFNFRSGYFVCKDREKYERLKKRYQDVYQYEIYNFSIVTADSQNTDQEDNEEDSKEVRVRAYPFRKEFDIVSVFDGPLTGMTLKEINLEGTFMVIAERHLSEDGMIEQPIHEHCLKSNMQLLHQGIDFFIYCKRP